jgi:hypothetical protein
MIHTVEETWLFLGSRVSSTRNPSRETKPPEGAPEVKILKYYSSHCECVTDCHECSFTGEPHVHAELGGCGIHPDAPGDWPAED